MKNYDDFDFIKNEFEKENINAPDALDENAVMNQLEGREQKKIKFYQSKAFKSVLSAAACVAVVITALAATMPRFSDKADIVPNVDTENSQQVLNTFTSVRDIKSMVEKIDKNNKIKGDALEEKAENESYDMSLAGFGGEQSSFAQTYKQVDAVDEGDIIKNDGKYIYWVDSSSNTVKIYSAKGKDTKLVSTIDDFEYDSTFDYSEAADYTEEYISDIYIYNDTLIVNNGANHYNGSEFNYATKTHIYDISDKTSPKETNSFEQSGYYTSSRMICSQLYVVSNYNVNSYVCKDDNDYVPYVCNGKTAQKESIALNDICYAENPNTASYLVVSAINVETGKKSADTKALFGAGTDIYCNENNMFIAMNKQEWDDNGEKCDAKVQLVKVQLTENDIQFAATGEVEGNTHNQFSMDEKDGNLRVATTSYNKDGKEINNLFVLNEKLETIGEVTGFAETESIKAVRFIGDMAYVITYEQTDPLFVIDLSDPAKPIIKGEVKITGFSSLLVPVDENTLLGIGYSTDGGDNDIDMEITDGIKLALFDISNPEKPQVLDSYVMKDSTSEAQETHRALVVNADKGYYAIPYNSKYYEYDELSHGAITFEVKDARINVTNTFKTEDSKFESVTNSGYVSRCTYIDDTLYVIDDNGNIFSFTVK